MSYKNSTKRLIASIALLSQLVYTVNPFVYAFFYYSMSQRALAQEAQLVESSPETSSNSETEETTSTASEEVISENSDEPANTQEEPVVSGVDASSDIISSEEADAFTQENENTETELTSEDSAVVAEDQVNETTSETESNTEPTSENEPQVEGEILGEGATSVRTESDSSDFIEAKEQVNGMECINPDSEIVTSTEEMWNLDFSKDIAETKDNVKAGIKYEFPLNKDVSVTFTCLPKNFDGVSPLKIERIPVSELDLPEGIYPADEYAYDITTDMENGTFEYDLTLPSTELNKDKVVLNYVEKNPSEKIESSDLQQIDSSIIEYGSRKMEVSELNHFTLFVKTYIDLLFTVEGTSFAQGADVAIKAGDLLANNYYRLSVKPSAGSRTYLNNCATGTTSMSYVYNLATNATIGADWEVGIHQFDSNGTCSSNNVSSPLLTQQFAVTAVPTISWPSTWTTPGTCVSDPLNDESPASTDLYGVTGTPAVGFNTDSTNYFFRERVDSNPLNNNGTWDQYAWVVLFQFSAGPYTYLASLNGKDDLVQLYKNTSPAGTVDFDPLLNDPAETLMWEAPASTYARTVDAGSGYYFVDWALPKALLEGLDIDTDTTKFFATSANANNYNKDHLQCYRILSDLSIVKTDSADPVYAGGSLGYTLTITNNGPDTAKSVVVTDTLPSGYSVTSVTPSVGSCSDTSAPSIQCELGDMVNGASATITIAGTAPSTAGTITNNTSVSCDTTLCTDTNQTNNTDSEDTTVLEAQGTLIVKKVINNDNGGTKTYSDFSFKVNNGSSVNFESDGQNDITVASGTYSVVENSAAGYTTTYNNCSNVVISNGGTATCTITNDDIQPKLTVTKVVINDNGGTKVVADFPLFVGNTSVTSGVQNGFNAGTYTVSETSVAGYTGTITGDCASNGSITLGIGDVKSCTITNNDQAGTLIVKKIVVNDNGGLLAANNFGFKVNNGSTVAFEADGQNDLTVSAGTYTIVEPAVTGYATTYDNCTNVAVANGGTATCTITNDDIQPKLKVTKIVTNDNGGTKVIADFPLFVGNTSVTSGVENGFNVGTYTVSETQQTGYSATFSGACDANGSVTLALGDVKECTITNNDIQPKLTVTKVVTTDNGGTKVVSDFPLFVGNTQVTSGVQNSFNAGSYVVSETNVSGYTATISGDCDANGNITLNPGDVKSCIITNDDQIATLIVTKVLVNDNGGSKDYDDFSFTINNGSPIAFEADGSNSIAVNAGTYSIVETAVTGYTITYDNCTNVSIPNGGTATCTITNDDQPATLIVKKVLIQDNGGTKSVNEFSFEVNNDSASSFEADGQNDLTVDAGTYSVVETAVSGYTTSYDNCSNVFIPNGGIATCTITNNDQAGTLIVTKVVTNDNGGTKTEADFGFSINGGNTVAFEADGTNNVNVSAGTYTVIEPAVYGYATTYDNCFEVVVSNGETETCTVTNNDIAPLLTVTKVVINDNNGVKQVSDFPLFVNQTQVTSGVQNSFAAGNYTVSETSQTGYAATISGDCSTNGAISLAVGDVKSCTITNDDIQPKLTVTKVVTNNNGGTKVIADFPLFVGNTQVTSGVENGFNVGSYVVSEANVSGYTATITGDCDENGNITLNPGDDKSCTITNDDQAATLIVKKVLVKDNGGTKEIEDFSFSVNDGYTIDFETDGQNDLTVDAGTYSVVETAASGYTTTYENCSEVPIPNGGTATCTITNNDQPATLTVKKVVVNDNGGLLEADDFSFAVNNESTLAFETDGQNDLTVDAGTYSVVETAAAGYATTYDNCSRVSIPNGGTATCTITNDDIAGTLIVKKVLDNKKLDSKTYTDFEFKVNDGNAIAFDSDGQNDLTVAAGTYTVVETAVDGYTTTYDNCTDVVVALDSTQTCTITNTIQPAKITVEKQTLPDGHQKTFEFTGDLSGNISDGQTLSSGDLAAGTYTVTEVAEEGWDLTGVSCTDDDSTYDLDKGQITFNVDWNEEVKCTVTNTQRGSISGTKYEYLGDEVESNTLGDWTINLYGSDWGLLTSTTTSNVDGSYQFANLVPGDYYICENNPEGWKQLTPSTGSTRPETTQICHSVSVEAGETVVEQDFENAKLSDVHGYKWEDLDQDGYRDICEFREGRIAQLDEECVPEPLLSGWRIFIDENKDGIYQPGNDETPGEPSMLTDDSEEHFGWYWFEDLMPGEYQICEVLESEWIQTYPYQSTEAYCHTVNLPDDTSEQTLNAVLAPEYNFGNYHELPTLLISKFNNKEGVDLRIGDEITYTIQVTVEEATAGNVKVTDLLPQGVEYKGSSWTATSTVRGDISGLGEPTYNSPGVWTLGDMIPEEIVTLTYTGIVENGTDDGIYKDLAWAKATEQNILALAEEDGNKIATNFVGTEIEVVSDPVEEDLKVDIGEDEKIEEVGEVLGASTSLPATGSATVLLIALLFGLIGGLGMFIYSRNISKNKKLVLGLVMLMATLFSAQPAYAAEGDNLYVRLEEPNASQTTNFDVSFVALDSNNDPIEIVCWKKGPSDVAFVTFGSPILLNNGGDTGVCSVTGSVLISDGDYKFKVSAETQTANPLDSVTKESEEVSVSYDGTKPGKPFDIEKERDNSCQFELSFKTADDGQTAYVEIYRDDEREFNASPSKLHKTIVIGPDSSYTFEDDLYGSECGKTFYYGIRAFDSLGNGSDLGEEEDTEKTTKVTKTTTETKEETGAILSSGGSVSSAAGDNSSEVVLPGDILGESNTASDDESNDGSFGTAFDGILDSLKNPKMLLIILAALLLLGYGIYRARKNR